MANRLIKDKPDLSTKDPLQMDKWCCDKLIPKGTLILYDNKSMYKKLSEKSLLFMGYTRK